MHYALVRVPLCAWPRSCCCCHFGLCEEERALGPRPRCRAASPLCFAYEVEARRAETHAQTFRMSSESESETESSLERMLSRYSLHRTRVLVAQECEWLASSGRRVKSEGRCGLQHVLQGHVCGYF